MHLVRLVGGMIDSCHTRDAARVEAAMQPLLTLTLDEKIALITLLSGLLGLRASRWLTPAAPRDIPGTRSCRVTSSWSDGYRRPVTDTGVDSQSRQPRRRRFATYNAFNLYEERRGPELARYDQVAEVIVGLDADVVAIQEIRTDHAPSAGDLLAKIAEAAGMTAAVTPAWWTEDDAQNPTYAIAPGAHTFHTGLMWRPGAGIEPDPRTLQTWGAGTFFHSLIRLTLRLDGKPVGFASYHAAPFGRQMRADQAGTCAGRGNTASGPGAAGRGHERDWCGVGNGPEWADGSLRPGPVRRR